ncbi:hypothetical protein BDAP_001700 [Binucleata daphniae]
MKETKQNENHNSYTTQNKLSEAIRYIKEIDLKFNSTMEEIEFKTRFMHPYIRDSKEYKGYRHVDHAGIADRQPVDEMYKKFENDGNRDGNGAIQKLNSQDRNNNIINNNALGTKKADEEDLKYTITRIDQKKKTFMAGMLETNHNVESEPINQNVEPNGNSTIEVNSTNDESESDSCFSENGSFEIDFSIYEQEVDNNLRVTVSNIKNIKNKISNKHDKKQKKTIWNKICSFFCCYKNSNENAELEAKCENIKKERICKVFITNKNHLEHIKEFAKKNNLQKIIKKDHKSKKNKRNDTKALKKKYWNDFYNTNKQEANDKIQNITFCIDERFKFVFVSCNTLKCMCKNEDFNYISEDCAYTSLFYSLFDFVANNNPQPNNGLSTLLLQKIPNFGLYSSLLTNFHMKNSEYLFKKKYFVDNFTNLQDCLIKLQVSNKKFIQNYDKLIQSARNLFTFTKENHLFTNNLSIENLVYKLSSEKKENSSFYIFYVCKYVLENYEDQNCLENMINELITNKEISYEQKIKVNEALNTVYDIPLGINDQ